MIVRFAPLRGLPCTSRGGVRSRFGSDLERAFFGAAIYSRSSPEPGCWMSCAGLDASVGATGDVAGCETGVVTVEGVGGIGGVADAAVAPPEEVGVRIVAFCAALTRSVATDLPAATAP